MHTVLVKQNPYADSVGVESVEEICYLLVVVSGVGIKCIPHLHHTLNKDNYCNKCVYFGNIMLLFYFLNLVFNSLKLSR